MEEEEWRGKRKIVVRMIPLNLLNLLNHLNPLNLLNPLLEARQKPR